MNALTLAISAGTSKRSACSSPQPSVGNMKVRSTSCSSSTAMRAARSWYSAWRGSIRTSAFGSTPAGTCPRNMRSLQPGTITGSNVGFGMKRHISRPARRKVRLPWVTTWMLRSL